MSPPPPAAMKDESLEDGIRRVGPWFHNIELAPGIRTREVSPTPQWRPVNFPYERWEVFRDVIPADLSGRRVLDIGSAEGFFAFELARRGAHVVAVDAAPNMIKRLKFAADVLHLSDKIEARIGTAEMLDTSERYDAVLCLALLYHLQSPFTFLQKLSELSDTIYLESAIDRGDQPYLFLKPQQQYAEIIPKWFPTRVCIVEMFKYCGFADVQDVEIPEFQKPEQQWHRAGFVATRKA